MVTSIVVSQIEDVKMAKLEIKNITKNIEFPAKFNGSERELKILKFGGYLKFATSDEFLS